MKVLNLVTNVAIALLSIFTIAYVIHCWNRSEEE